MASLTLSNAKSSRIFWKEIAFSNPLTFRRACGLVINFWLWQSTTRSKSSARKIFQPRTTPTTRKGMILVRVFGVFRGLYFSPPSPTSTRLSHKAQGCPVAGLPWEHHPKSSSTSMRLWQNFSLTGRIWKPEATTSLRLGIFL